MKEKRRLRKGVLSFALAVIMIFGTLTGIVPGTSIKVKAETKTGVWSNGIDYSYDTATGVLTVTGNGSTTVDSSTVVFDYRSYTFNESFSNISRIVISEGITSIGGLAFADWGIRNDLTIEIPSTVTSIGDFAFSSMTSGSVSVIMNARPDNITTFDTRAFNGSKNGEFITPYASEWKASDKCSYDSTNNTITFNSTYKGIFTLSGVTYTVTFKDYDGSVLKTQENVEYNTSATAPDDPTREGYTFTGWDKSFTNITANTEVTAQYAINKYTVTFKDYDGTVLKTQENVEYNASATAPDDPTREGYSFECWDKAFTNITEDTTVTAIYTINSYTVKWVNYDDTVLKEDTLDYGVTPEYTGTTPTKPADEQYTYTFADWTPEISAVTGDVIYKATYTQAEIKKDDGEKSVSTEVKKDEKSPEVKAANLTDDFAESTLSSEEKTAIEEAINNGEDVKVDVYLEIKDISDTISASDREKVNAAATDADKIEFFDISLFKEISIAGRPQGETLIRNLTTPLKLTIGIPKSFPAVVDGYTRTYVVLRLHEGSVTVLPTVLNADGTLSFETDQFSTYALAYTDTKEDTSETTEATTVSTTATTTAAASTSDATTASAKTAAEEKTAPKTGDSMPITVLVVLMLSAAGALAFMDLKKKKN